MPDILCQPIDVSGGYLLFGALFWTLLIVALVYWWARKSAHHPEYAAAFEAAYLDPTLRKLGLDSLADKDLVAKGQTLYAKAQAAASQIEAEAGVLVEQAKAKYAEAKLLRDRAGQPPQ